MDSAHSVSFWLILLLYFVIHLFIRLILAASITFNRTRVTCANIWLWRSVLYVLNCVNKMLIKWSIFWAYFVIHAYLLCTELFPICIHFLEGDASQ